MEINDLHNLFNTLIAICAVYVGIVQVIIATQGEENSKKDNFPFKKNLSPVLYTPFRTSL